MSRYTSKSLTGIKVGHDVSEFKEGEVHILTLKDTSVLDGDSLNDAPDELEDIQLKDLAKTKKNIEARKKKPIYDVFGALDGSKTSILSQYDEEQQPEGFVLQGGVVETKEARENKLAEIRRKLSGAGGAGGLKAPSSAVASSMASAKLAFDLNTESSVATEYYTQEEMIAFRKPRKERKERGKKRKKVRLSDILEDTAPTDSTGTDHGSRASSTREQQEQVRKALEQQNKDAAYEAAVIKSQNATKLLMADEDEASLLQDDDELYQSLAEARKKALEQKRLLQQQSKSSIAEKIAESLAKRRVAQSSSMDTADATDQELILTDTTEFCRVLEKQKEFEEDQLERRIKPELASVKKERDSSSNNDDTMDTDYSKPHGIESTGNRGDEGNNDDDDEEDGHDSNRNGSTGRTAIGDEEALVSDSLSATLRVIRQTAPPSMKDTEMYAGRRTDYIAPESSDDPAPGINLEYRDEYGRLLTPKEAFRQLSYKFHGKDPGKRKQEKMKRQYEEEMKLRYMSNTDTPLGTLAKLQEKTKMQQSPFIVLSGKKGLINTSELLGGTKAPVTEVDTSSGSSSTTSSGKSGVLHRGASGGKKVEFSLTGSKRKSGGGDSSTAAVKRPKHE